MLHEEEKGEELYQREIVRKRGGKNTPARPPAQEKGKVKVKTLARVHETGAKN